jgi:hypothetical protein
MSKERGSEVLRRLSGCPRPIESKHLESVFRLIDSVEEIKILDWRPKGTPQLLDAISGRAELSLKSVGKFVDGLFDDKGLVWNVHVFPIGVVETNLAIVEFDSQQAR